MTTPLFQPMSSSTAAAAIRTTVSTALLGCRLLHGWAAVLLFKPFVFLMPDTT